MSSVESSPAAGLESVPALLCRGLSPTDHTKWDEFVLSHEHATPFHLIGWKTTIEDSFGYKPKYLLVECEGAIKAILPLFYISNPIMGKVLLSTPFAVYGGILAATNSARLLLAEKVHALGRELGVDYIELRNFVAGQCVGTPNVSRYVGFTQEVVAGDKAILDSLPKKTRNLVRKALKQPFEMRRSVRDTEVFEHIYAKSMRRLGTPSFPRKYFRNLLANLGEMIDVGEVWLGGKPMAVSLSFVFRGCMHIYYAAAETKYNALGPNTFMYFDHLRWAGENGLSTFDFGRCKRNTGVYEFKRHWNTTMLELPYEVLLIRRKDLPSITPSNPKFKLIIRMWQLLPLWFTKIIGPRLIRLFP